MVVLDKITSQITWCPLLNIAHCSACEKYSIASNVSMRWMELLQNVVAVEPDAPVQRGVEHQVCTDSVDNDRCHAIMAVALADAHSPNAQRFFCPRNQYFIARHQADSGIWLVG